MINVVIKRVGCKYHVYILQQREYMSAEEAKTIMYDKETWNQYKTVLLQRTVDGLHRNQNEKVLWQFSHSAT